MILRWPIRLRTRYYENIPRHMAERSLWLYQAVAAAQHGGESADSLLQRWQILAGWIEETVRSGIARLRHMFRSNLLNETERSGIDLGEDWDG